MCIRVTRWFFCPVPDSQRPAQQQLRPAMNAYLPMFNWFDQDPVPTTERIQLDLPIIPGYFYMRHKKEYWRRCALMDVAKCMQTPLGHHTELYKLPCPDCSGDHPSVLAQKPFQTHIVDNPNPSSELVAEYAEELTVLFRSFLLHEIEAADLDLPSWLAYVRGLCCTEHKSHVVRDHPYRQCQPACLDCANTRRAWSHNLSRAARNVDAFHTRIKHSKTWVILCTLDHGIADWRQNHFADMRYQLELNLGEGTLQNFNKMLAKIAENVAKLIRLGPTCEPPSPHRPRTDEFWRHLLIFREYLAHHLAWSVCFDTGVTEVFIEHMMRDHILTALCPDLDINNAPPGYTILDCQQPASPAMQELSRILLRVYTSDDNHPKMSASIQRRQRLYGLLDQFRAIYHRDVAVRQRIAESCMRSCEIPAAEVAAHIAVTDETECSICGDEFDAENDGPPVHLRVAQMPCCSKLIHVRCFKGILIRSKGSCPYCNEEIGLTGFFPGYNEGEWSWEIKYPDQVPVGLVDFPTRVQHVIFENPEWRYLDVLDPIIAAEEGIPLWAVNPFRPQPQFPGQANQGNDADDGVD
ncbi:hypothetical protein FALBO_685 [Fusarium albosuccineum]|uniref:RING-type domain-containing protein n=1 Tax=Fusarium albosuccineum TaxID=1237068 RepID=A0A8H4LPJ6_9HYPO|nr:hypothetical protein FALBO_685 [Fusarium albosuccineum]